MPDVESDGGPYPPAVARASLRQVDGPLEVVLSERRSLVGRSPRANLVLSDARVSRSHAVIERLGRHWAIADLGSRNGSYVNGVRVVGLTWLSAGDEILIGDTRFIVHVESAPDDSAVTEAAEAAPRLTGRERDVLLALLRPTGRAVSFVQAATAAEIAAMLGVSTAAVNQHLGRLYNKFGVHDGGTGRRTRLANEALRRGAVTLADIRAAGRAPGGTAVPPRPPSARSAPGHP